MPPPSNIAIAPSPLTIRSGNATVIATGSVIPFQEQDLEITFSVEDTPFAVVLQQVSDTANPQARWEIGTKPEQPQRAILRMINIQNSPISGIPEPLRLWASAAYGIYLQLRHVKIAGVGTVFHFTIYLVPELPPKVETPTPQRATPATATA
jgi:hypothetical protein